MPNKLQISESTRNALNAGVFSALVFAGMNVLGIVFVLATKELPSTGEAVTDTVSSIIGIVLEAAFALVTAWRFKNGKGLLLGSLLVVMFALEVFLKFVSGTTNGGWLFFYAAVFIGLLNGIRGAWAARRPLKTVAGPSD